MRSYPPYYTIRIESPARSIGTILHKGALAPVIAELLKGHDDIKARVEAADAHPLRLSKKPRGFDSPSDHDEFGGL